MDSHGFGVDNLPYGVDQDGHVVVAWGDQVVDLTRASGLGVGPDVWGSGSLNAFFALGPDAWNVTRQQLQSVIATQPGPAYRPRSEVELRLPWVIGDYADFYGSRDHATNVGRLLRPEGDPLPPAWLHLPIGYQGRAGSIVVSGSDVPRPAGLSGPGGEFGPTQRLDVEVELGFVVGAGSRRGRPVSAGETDRHVFGVVLLNDWSARDIQAFESRPLGPFLGKSFATSISPWVIPLAALARWRVEGPVQDPEPAAYLKASEPRAFDVHLQLAVNGHPVSTTSSAGMYWTMAQQLAHLTVNGSGLRTGDLFASGTISGPHPGSQGCLLELTAGGQRPIMLGDGSRRSWLLDGDRVSIRGWCGSPGGPDWLSLGEVTGQVVPHGTEVRAP
jgi:fumarylacetoacetase